MNVLIMDDEKIGRDCGCAAVEAAGHRAVAVPNLESGFDRLEEQSFDVVLLALNPLDQASIDRLPRIQQRWPRLAVIVCTANATIPSVVQTMRLGAIDYLEKPFSAERLAQRLSRIVQNQAIRPPDVSPTPEAILEPVDPIVRKLYDIAFRAAGTPASILILGESGTGKSMLARAIHQRSFCHEKAFVTVNCPSLSRELLESDLFGHLKGSFTGAVRDTWGKVQAADGGTLFLDEIGELPVEIQPKLLRLLQEKEYERVGENKTRTANVRVIAASNRNLKQSVSEGQFREDLFYRLNVIALELPPLRQRPEELLLFARQYVEFFSAHFQCGCRYFSDAALRRIQSYSWPGNLRELRNASERAVILSAGPEIMPGDLPIALAEDTSGRRRVRVGGTVSLHELKTEHIRRVLSYSRSLNQAARILGIDKTTLYRKRKRFQRRGSEVPSSDMQVAR